MPVQSIHFVTSDTNYVPFIRDFVSNRGSQYLHFAEVALRNATTYYDSADIHTASLINIMSH